MDSIHDLSFGNGRPIEGAANIPDANALEEEYQDEQYKQSEVQRFLRQHDHITTLEDLGFAGYDPALEDKYRPLVPQLDAAEPIKERVEVLRHFSTVENGGYRRYMTPPTTPEPLASLPVNRAHSILPPYPDLLPKMPRISDDLWYSHKFYAGTMGHLRTTFHALEASFICNKLDLPTELILLAYRLEFPFVPWSDADIRKGIEEARWHAKLYVWKAEEVDILREAARQNQSEETVWLALRETWWPYYPKDRKTVSLKYAEVQLGRQLFVGWQRYDEGQQRMADAGAIPRDNR